MTQTILAEVKIPIIVPDDMVLIQRLEYEQLKLTKSDIWWTLEEVVSRLKISKATFTNKILLNPALKTELEVFTKYPNKKGEKYYFHAEKMAQYLKDNFSDIIAYL